MNFSADNLLRQRLIKHIRGGEAFMPVEEMLKKINYNVLGEKPAGLPYSFYQQFHHLKFAQYDIIEFYKNPNYKAPVWPNDYWTDHSSPDNEREWQELVDQYFSEREEFCNYIADENNDLFMPIPHGSGQTLLREALLVIEHTAYHTGQLMIILRLLNLH